MKLLKKISIKNTFLWWKDWKFYFVPEEFQSVKEKIEYNKKSQKKNLRNVLKSEISAMPQNAKYLWNFS